MTELELTKIYKEPVEIARSIYFLFLQKRNYYTDFCFKLSQLEKYEDDESEDISYPIPVIEISKLLDIEVWLDKIIISSRMKLKDKDKIDFNYFKNFNALFFGCREYCYFFYDIKEDINIFNEKIKMLEELEEEEIGIQIYLDLNIERDNLIKIVNKINNMKIWHYRLR